MASGGQIPNLSSACNTLTTSLDALTASSAGQPPLAPQPPAGQPPDSYHQRQTHPHGNTKGIPCGVTPGSNDWGSSCDIRRGYKDRNLSDTPISLMSDSSKYNIAQQLRAPLSYTSYGSGAETEVFPKSTEYRQKPRHVPSFCAGTPEGERIGTLIRDFASVGEYEEITKHYEVGTIGLRRYAATHQDEIDGFIRDFSKRATRLSDDASDSSVVTLGFTGRKKRWTLCPSSNCIPKARRREKIVGQWKILCLQNKNEMFTVPSCVHEAYSDVLDDCEYFAATLCPQQTYCAKHSEQTFFVNRTWHYVFRSQFALQDIMVFCDHAQQVRSVWRLKSARDKYADQAETAEGTLVRVMYFVMDYIRRKEYDAHELINRSKFTSFLTNNKGGNIILPYGASQVRAPTDGHHTSPFGWLANNHSNSHTNTMVSYVKPLSNNNQSDEDYVSSDKSCNPGSVVDHRSGFHKMSLHCGGDHASTAIGADMSGGNRLSMLPALLSTHPSTVNGDSSATIQMSNDASTNVGRTAQQYLSRSSMTSQRSSDLRDNTLSKPCPTAASTTSTVYDTNGTAEYRDVVGGAFSSFQLRVNENSGNWNNNVNTTGGMHTAGIHLNNAKSNIECRSRLKQRPFVVSQTASGGSMADPSGARQQLVAPLCQYLPRQLSDTLEPPTSAVVHKTFSNAPYSSNSGNSYVNNDFDYRSHILVGNKTNGYHSKKNEPEGLANDGKISSFPTPTAHLSTTAPHESTHNIISTNTRNLPTHNSTPTPNLTPTPSGQNFPSLFDRATEERADATTIRRRYWPPAELPQADSIDRKVKNSSLDICRRIGVPTPYTAQGGCRTTLPIPENSLGMTHKHPFPSPARESADVQRRKRDANTSPVMLDRRINEEGVHNPHSLTMGLRDSTRKLRQLNRSTLPLHHPKTAALHSNATVIKANTAAIHPNTGAIRPNTAAIHPNTAAIHPNTAAIHPNTAAIHPNTAAIHPNTAAIHPNTPAIHPDTGAIHSNTCG